MDALPSQTAVEYALEALLLEQGEMRAKDAVECLAKHFKLSEAQRRITRNDGRGSKFANIVQWARNRLADQGVIDRRERGVWRIAEHQITIDDLIEVAFEGLEALFKHPPGPTPANDLSIMPDAKLGLPPAARGCSQFLQSAEIEYCLKPRCLSGP